MWLTIQRSFSAHRRLHSRGESLFSKSEEFEDLVAAGVIDPAKVTRCALQNAASLGGLMLTTEVLISELPNDDKPRALPGGMDM